MFPVRSEAILEIMRRADMENSQFIDPSELISLANAHVRRAYREVVAAYGEATFVSDYIISDLVASSQQLPTTWPTGPTLVNGVRVAQQTLFPLPTDFGAMLRCQFTQGAIQTIETDNDSVIYQTTNNNQFWTPMHAVEPIGMVFDSTPRSWNEGQVGYWIQAKPSSLYGFLDDKPVFFAIAFLPVPVGIVSVHIQYVPTPPQWGLDDTVTIVLPDDAWRYVRDATAAELLEKERSDASVMNAKAAQALDDIQKSRLNPDFASAPQVVDVYGGSGISPYGRRRQVW
jgi:hypothetical protein